MTTKVTVEANHGWPVQIDGIDPKTGEKVPWNHPRVPAGETMTVYVHSSMDLRIHEVQPDELTTNADGAAEA